MKKEEKDGLKAKRDNFKDERKTNVFMQKATYVVNDLPLPAKY